MKLYYMLTIILLFAAFYAPKRVLYTVMNIPVHQLRKTGKPVDSPGSRLAIIFARYTFPLFRRARTIPPLYTTGIFMTTGFLRVGQAPCHKASCRPGKTRDLF